MDANCLPATDDHIEQNNFHEHKKRNLEIQTNPQKWWLFKVEKFKQDGVKMLLSIIKKSLPYINSKLISQLPYMAFSSLLLIGLSIPTSLFSQAQNSRGTRICS
jgi:hypothetical protein